MATGVWEAEGMSESEIAPYIRDFKCNHCSEPLQPFYGIQNDWTHVTPGQCRDPEPDSKDINSRIRALESEKDVLESDLAIERKLRYGAQARADALEARVKELEGRLEQAAYREIQDVARAEKAEAALAAHHKNKILCPHCPDFDNRAAFTVKRAAGRDSQVTKNDDMQGRRGRVRDAGIRGVEGDLRGRAQVQEDERPRDAERGAALSGTPDAGRGTRPEGVAEVAAAKSPARRLPETEDGCGT